MDEKELKALATEWKQATEDLKKANEGLTEAMKGKADAKKVEEYGEKAIKLQENLEKLSTQFDAIQVELKQKGNFKEGKSWDVQLKEDIADKIKQLKDGKISRSGKADAQFGNHCFDIEVKTGTPLTVTSNAGGFDLRTAVPLPQRLPGIGRAPDEPPMLLDIVRQGATSSNQITWIERTARTEGAVAKAEGTVYGESLYTYEQKKATVEKIPHFTKVTEEMMWDADYLVSEIKNEHMEQLRRKVDYYLLNGTGTSPQILGVLQNANAYTNTDLNNKVVAANNSDAVRAAINQIRVLKYKPNYICMYPSDIALAELAKSNTAEYVNLMLNGRLHGLPVIENLNIGTGKVLVGDFSKVTLFYNGGITVSVYDQNESDPIYGLYTIVSKVRVASKIQVCDYANAFCYDDLSDIVTAITV